MWPSGWANGQFDLPQGISGAIIRDADGGARGGARGEDDINGGGDDGLGGDGDGGGGSGTSTSTSGGGSGGRRWLLGSDDVISVVTSDETYWGMAGYFHDRPIEEYFLSTVSSQPVR